MLIRSATGSSGTGGDCDRPRRGSESSPPLAARSAGNIARHGVSGTFTIPVAATSPSRCVGNRRRRVDIVSTPYPARRARRTQSAVHRRTICEIGRGASTPTLGRASSRSVSALSIPCVDLALMSQSHPRRVGDLLSTVYRLVADGELPLPEITHYALGDAATASGRSARQTVGRRWYSSAQSGHTSVVVPPKGPAPSGTTGSYTSSSSRRHRLFLAEKIAEERCGRIVLSSRSEPDPRRWKRSSSFGRWARHRGGMRERHRSRHGAALCARPPPVFRCAGVASKSDACRPRRVEFTPGTRGLVLLVLLGMVPPQERTPPPTAGWSAFARSARPTHHWDRMGVVGRGGCAAEVEPRPATKRRPGREEGTATLA